MDNLTDIIKEVVFSYAGGGFELQTVKLADEERKTFAVSVVDRPVRHHPPQIMVMVHIEGDRVIIDEDLTDRPLVDALVRAGIPREKIVLAYANEPVPTV